jgi:A/G-specific adenine glycosylase
MSASQPHVDFLSLSDRKQFRKSLLVWFHKNRRDLPWRRTRDPYPIWISEIMLQQTQVAAVIPFFQRFMSRFPTVDALASATEQEVLKNWEGLGYYRRARHLHQAAKVIVEEHGGRFPASHELVASLPGLGRYSTGAILSQAFDAKLPIVDANIARILCRLFVWNSELELRETQSWLWDTAARLLPAQQPGDFNQAFMELGQTVCIPRQPMCLLCPVRSLCRGFQHGVAADLPKRKSKLQLSHQAESAFLIHKRNRLLLAQRNVSDNRWANMWEFPTFPTGSRVLRSLGNLLHEQLGIRIEQLHHVGSLRYGITRFKVTLRCYRGTYLNGRPHSNRYQKLAWVKPSDLKNYPLSIPQRRLAALGLENS